MISSMSVHDPNPFDPLHPQRIAMVLSNPASTTTRRPVGFWWSELTHSWLAFTERGYEVAIFSPAGELVRGRTITGFANIEIDFANNAGKWALFRTVSI